MKRLVAALVLLAANACLADQWAPPTQQTYLAAHGGFRVTITPRAVTGPLAYFSDKADGKDPAGQQRGALQKSPVAKVERWAGKGTWTQIWVRPLVNDVAPPSALLADGAKFLVTFDNWHSAGYGDDVVVIYDARGQLVRKLSLEQILPAAYVHQLPRTVSSRWWGGEHRLVDSDRFVELQVVVPGKEARSRPEYVPVRIRLSDGAVVPPSGKAWDAALAIANRLEAERLAAWDALRKLRSSPVSAPTTKDTRAWRTYMFEIRDRVATDQERMGGFLLAAPGQDSGFHDAKSIAREIEDYDAAEPFADKGILFASPTSARLADVLVKALNARDADSMKGLRIVFLGAAADGARVANAAKPTGAAVLVVDSRRPFPPGEPLPEVPPALWMPPYF